jgi:small subunit ribosomal protein S3
MIERKFVAENLKEYQIEEYLRSVLGKAGMSYIKVQRTPLGEKIIICASRPGIIVGKSGSNITRLTKELKERFKLENPQIELLEAENPMSDASIVAESIANSLERFGTARFKGIGHKAMSDIMNAGARGVEILISGKVPSSRAKTWRFYMGYLKKSGDIAVSGVNTAYAAAKLKTGIIGVQVRIMPSSTKLPDDIEPLTAEDIQARVQEAASAKAELVDEKAKKKPKKKEQKSEKPKAAKKKAAKKTEVKSEAKSEEPKSKEAKSEEPEQSKIE